MPKKQANRQSATLKKIFKAAFNCSPDWNRFNVSIENVEKVVKEPSKPTTKAARHAALISMRSAINT